MKDIPSLFGQMSLTSCLSGQISRRFGKIAVEITFTRGPTRGPTLNGSYIGLDFFASWETLFVCARFWAQVSRSDGFFREALSSISLWMELRHKVSISCSPSRDLGEILAPFMGLVHLWKASVPLFCRSSLDEHVRRTLVVWHGSQALQIILIWSIMFDQ